MVWSKLKTSTTRSGINSLLLANIRSLDNKLDLLQLRLSTQKEKRNSWAFHLTETWLNDNLLDSAFELDGMLLFQADRDPLVGEKQHKDWCTNCPLINNNCSAAVEYLTVKCQLHYLLWEFTTVFPVYIPLSAIAKDALSELHSNISSLQNKLLQAFFRIAGDLNHVKLLDILPNFYQHITVATRGVNTLDRVYANRHGSYRAVPCPHLGFSNHTFTMLVPAYCPLMKSKKPYLMQSSGPRIGGIDSG